jgi:hypothetical protein
MDTDTMMTFLRTRIEDEGDTRRDGSFLSNDSYEASGYSDGSSLGRLPTFHFSLNALTTFATVKSVITSAKTKGSGKAIVLVAALEVEGPDTVRIKHGPDTGKEVSVLRILCGDEAGDVAKVTAWREVADEMAGSGSSPGVKRGDVVHLESLSPPCPYCVFRAESILRYSYHLGPLDADYGADFHRIAISQVKNDYLLPDDAV